MKSLLVSHCLFGENVRYDGGNCQVRADYLARLKHKYNLIFICPEVMAGMSVPRAPIELKDGQVIDQQGNDLTTQFDRVKDHLKQLVQDNQIEIALLKDHSPSCGPRMVYDGSFSGLLIPGQGHIASFLANLGIKLYSESQVEELL